MLKIGAVQFKSKCPRHPKYRPAADPHGMAIKGACKRCEQLRDIHQAHAKLTGLVNDYRSRYNEAAPRPPRSRRQLALFAEVA